MLRFCTFALVLLSLPALVTAQVKFTKHADKIDVAIDGKPFTTFYYAGDAPKPYLHPLRAASGKIVTRMYPMEQVEGETRDHPHHRGLWFTHGDVNGLDFWINEAGPKRKPNTGVIVPLKVMEIKDGKNGVIKASFEWRTPDGQPLLEEVRTMTFSGDANTRRIDFDVTFTAKKQPVKFGDTKEGFFAIRLSDKLKEERGGTGTMTNAEGMSKEKDVWGKQSPWVDYSGTLDGEKVGIAILDHPGNPVHPTYWHSRGYGLFAANAFGKRDFTRDKTQDGSKTIQPGENMRFRYRVLIHAGDTAEAKIAEAYQQYKAGK